MSSTPLPTVGRIVIAAVWNTFGQIVERPGIVTSVRDETTVQATVFYSPEDQVGASDSQLLTYDEKGAVRGSWHWPNRTDGAVVKAAGGRDLSAVKMRAKLRVGKVTKHGTGDNASEDLEFRAVGGKIGANDVDEDNNFARFTPMALLDMTINNPALHGQFKEGDEFYVDFIPVKK